jgi:hypothetical protein
MQFSPLSHHLILFRSKYPSQHPVLKHPLSLCSSLDLRDQVSHPYRTTGKIIALYISKFYVFQQQMRRLRVLNWMVASITEFSLFIIYFSIKFRLSTLINIWTVLHFQSICLLSLWFCPAFWWWDINIHLVFSVFTFRWTSLLASVKSFSVFLYGLCVTSQ